MLQKHLFMSWQLKGIYCTNSLYILSIWLTSKGGKDWIPRESPREALGMEGVEDYLNFYDRYDKNISDMFSVEAVNLLHIATARARYMKHHDIKQSQRRLG